MKLGSKSYNLQRYLPRNPDNKRELERMRGTHLRYYYDYWLVLPNLQNTSKTVLCGVQNIEICEDYDVQNIEICEDYDVQNTDTQNWGFRTPPKNGENVQNTPKM